MSLEDAMTYEEARRTRLQSGRWEGKTLAQVARSLDGIRFLRFLRGLRLEGEPRLAEALVAYVDDPRTRRHEEHLTLYRRIPVRRYMDARR